MKIRLGGKSLRIDPRSAIGKGGEADVYDIDGGKALKLFKLPSHPDYAGQPVEQQAAGERLDEHQRKLLDFPRSVPPRVVAPEEMATVNGGRIVGYTMKLVQGAEVLLRYGDRTFRDAGIAPETVLALLRDLHATVAATHRAGIVIGDFNDLNVLVSGTVAYLIDADSFQYGGYPCRVFTTRFLDPLLCDPKTRRAIPIRPHSEDSDWYAFAILVMQSVLFVGPYGGVYRPQDPSRLVAPEARPFARITVFHSEVRYPKPALPYKVLPDDLLEQFHLVFEKDRRGVFPFPILERLRWTTCTRCGSEHARPVCPFCTAAAPASVKVVTRVLGRVRSTRLFSTPGTIVHATAEGGRLLWLYHEKGAFKREDGSTVFSGSLDPRLRFGLVNDETLVGKTGEVVTFSARCPSVRLAVDSFRHVPVFDTNARFRYWVRNGQLQRDGQLGPVVIGEVLEAQTFFWVGPQFGFGFYRAGSLSVAFVFDAERRGVNDTVKLPPVSGQLVDAACFFGESRAWFFTAAQEGADLVHRAFVVRPTGDVEASTEARAEDGSWLSSFSGKCAAGNFLLSVTDEGLVRVEPDAGRIVVTKEFPDAEPFVTSGARLFAGAQSLFVVDRREIRSLTIS